MRKHIMLAVLAALLGAAAAAPAGAAKPATETPMPSGANPKFPPELNPARTIQPAGLPQVAATDAQLKKLIFAYVNGEQEDFPLDEKNYQAAGFSSLQEAQAVLKKRRDENAFRTSILSAQPHQKPDFKQFSAAGFADEQSYINWWCYLWSFSPECLVRPAAGR